MQCTYKHLSVKSVWTIPRFWHKKGPLVCLGLERSLGLEDHGCITELNLATNWGFGERSPQRKFCQKIRFSSKTEQKMLCLSMRFIGKDFTQCTKRNIFSTKKIVFRWDSSEQIWKECNNLTHYTSKLAIFPTHDARKIPSIFNFRKILANLQTIKAQ